MPNPERLLADTLYLIALVNPVSKIAVISLLMKETEARETQRLAFKASLVALALLLGFAAFGDVLFSQVFRVEMYSFRIVGGLVLVFIGLKALGRGIFFEDEKTRLTEMAVVPLASPMIAGPATLTAVLYFTAESGLLHTLLATVVAVSVNLAVMLMARRMGTLLVRYNLMGALIRITGLIVATIAVQMILSGLGEWLRASRAVAP